MPTAFSTRTRLTRSQQIASLLLAAGVSISLAVPQAWAGGDDGGEPAKTGEKTAETTAEKAAEKAADKPAESDKSGDAKKAEKTIDGPSNAELLNDFVHYVLIDRSDLAQSMGQTLLDRGVAPADFVKLVDTGTGYKRFEQAVVRGQRQSGLEPVAAGLLKAYEDGRLASVRDPGAVTNNIKMLTGTARERDYARSRLVAAGEYAMPQLFTALLDRTQPATSAEVRQVMVELGRHAVMPLCAALPKLGPSEQEAVLDVLSDIPYPASLPFMHEVLANTSSAQTKAAAEKAVYRLSGMVGQASQADRFTGLANEYYAGTPGLINFPGESHQLVWSFEPQIGLVPVAIESKLFPSMMALRLSEEALRRDPKHPGALATWLAANFKREMNTPEGYENPLYAKDRRDAMYFAVAAGSTPVQSVLARALDSNDTPLARRAIAALEKSAGGSSLWNNSTSQGMAGGRTPLLEALRYPSRRVQIEAALALAAASPRESFNGSEQVVRLLASAVRDSGAKFALVIASESERQSSISDLLRSQGYTTLTPGSRLDESRQSIADAPGVDLMVIDLPLESTAATIAEATNDAKLRATPIMAMTNDQGMKELSMRFGQDQRVRIARQGMSPKEITEAAAQLSELNAAGGELKGEEADVYRDRAIKTLRDLGLTSGSVFNISDAQSPLIAAMGTAKGEVKGHIADVLAYIPTKQAQSALVDAALEAAGDERVQLLTHGATSAKRAGNQLSPAQVERIVDLAKSGEGAEATAAAALVGALNLAGGEIVPLILGDK